MGDRDEQVLLGEIVSVHGVRGLVKVRTFTERAEDLTAYGPLFDQQGREISVTIRGQAKGALLAAVDDVRDRDRADRYRGRRLYVPRSALPPAETQDDEYYYADLIGLAVEFEDGRRFGEVIAVQAFGAGDMLEVRPDEGNHSALLPFNREIVPVVDLEAGRVVIAPLPGMLD